MFNPKTSAQLIAWGVSKETQDSYKAAINNFMQLSKVECIIDQNQVIDVQGRVVWVDAHIYGPVEAKFKLPLRWEDYLFDQPNAAELVQHIHISFVDNVL